MIDKALELLEEINLLINDGWISIIAHSKDFFVIKVKQNNLTFVINKHLYICIFSSKN